MSSNLTLWNRQKREEEALRGDAEEEKQARIRDRYKVRKVSMFSSSPLPSELQALPLKQEDIRRSVFMHPSFRAYLKHPYLEHVGTSSWTTIVVEVLSSRHEIKEADLDTLKEYEKFFCSKESMADLCDAWDLPSKLMAVEGVKESAGDGPKVSLFRRYIAGIKQEYGGDCVLDWAKDLIDHFWDQAKLQVEPKLREKKRGDEQQKKLRGGDLAAAQSTPESAARPSDIASGGTQLTLFGYERPEANEENDNDVMEED